MEDKTELWARTDTFSPDYSHPNLFGDVRTFPAYVRTGKYASTGYITSAGWHKVNQLYRIERQYGARDPLVMFVVSGSGQVRAGGESFTVAKDEVCLIPPEEPCAYMQTGVAMWEFYWIHFTGSYASELFGDIFRIIGHHAAFPTIRVRPLMEQVIGGSFTGVSGEVLASSMLHRILETMLAEVSSAGGGTGLVQEVLAHLSDERTRTLSMDELEARYHYSKEYIIRTFKEQLGVTPYHYWRELKLARAKQLLATTTIDIADIAADAGFSSIESFSKQFGRRFGISPGRCRRFGDMHAGKKIDI